ncbi:hypothetical protein OROGR_016773 [Orobanche gracilis]
MVQTASQSESVRRSYGRNTKTLVTEFTKSEKKKCHK